MRNRLHTMWRESAFVLLVLLQVHHICATKDDQEEHLCPPSSCGKISNISYPFRLQGDPEKCGNKSYELGCENNVTVLYLNSEEFHVEAINYNNYTVRVVDPALQLHNCSSLPLRSLSRSNFSDTYTYTYSSDPYQAVTSSYENWGSLSFEHIVFVNCKHTVRENGKYVESGECVKWDSKGYAYAVVGDLKAEDLEVGCDIKLVAPTSLRTFNNHSYTSMHSSLAYGFEISWVQLACDNYCPDGFCYFDSASQKLYCGGETISLYGNIRQVLESLVAELLENPEFFARRDGGKDMHQHMKILKITLNKITWHL